MLSLDPLWRSFLNYVHQNGGWKGPAPMWDTLAPVNESRYDAQVRDKAMKNMNSFTRMLETLTLNGVQADGEEGEGDVDVDERPWNDDI